MSGATKTGDGETPIVRRMTREVVRSWRDEYQMRGGNEAVPTVIEDFIWNENFKIPCFL